MSDHIPKENSCQIHPNPIIAWIAHQYNCTVYGQAVIAMIFYACALGVGAGAYVAMVCGYSAKDSHWIAGLTIISVVLIQNRIGWLLDKLGVIRASQEWHALRTETLRNILKKVRDK